MSREREEVKAALQRRYTNLVSVARGGSAQAATNLGRMYRDGLVPDSNSENNKKRAFIWLVRGFAMADSTAKDDLEKMMQEGCVMSKAALNEHLQLLLRTIAIKKCPFESQEGREAQILFTQITSLDSLDLIYLVREWRFAMLLDDDKGAFGDLRMSGLLGTFFDLRELSTQIQIYTGSDSADPEGSSAAIVSTAASAAGQGDSSGSSSGGTSKGSGAILSGSDEGDKSAISGLDIIHPTLLISQPSTDSDNNASNDLVAQLQSILGWVSVIHGKNQYWAVTEIKRLIEELNNSSHGLDLASPGSASGGTMGSPLETIQNYTVPTMNSDQGVSVGVTLLEAKASAQDLSGTPFDEIVTSGHSSIPLQFVGALIGGQDINNTHTVCA